jgi:UDP-glucose:(heptosyl)LPS alpha-1,3-glucosyltransferase
MRIALNYRNVDPNKGGAETYVVDLAGALLRRGHQVTLVSESLRTEAIPGQVEVLKVPVSGWSRASKVRSFAINSEVILRSNQDRFDVTMGFINTWHHDVIIPQGGLRAGSILHNSRRFRSPVRRGLYRLSKWFSPGEWNYDGIERRQYDPALGAKVIAVSRLVAGHLEKFREVDPQRIEVIYNSIDPDRFKVENPSAVRSETRAKYGIGDDEDVGLFVGHNFWLKGLAPLLEALAVRTGGEPVRLLVSGRGKLGPFRRMVDRYGLSDQVKLLGFVPDVASLFHAADFFVSPTYYDPCSLVVMEALACGLPVITTGCNGAGELITQGREGFVIETPHHQSDLIAAIDAMTHRESRNAMAFAARELGRKQTFDAHVDKLESLFARIAVEKSADRFSRSMPGHHIGRDSNGGRAAVNRSSEAENHSIARERR